MTFHSATNSAIGSLIKFVLFDEKLRMDRLYVTKHIRLLSEKVR